MRIVDPLGQSEDWGADAGPLWVHLEDSPAVERLASVPTGTQDLRFFGPGVEREAVRAELAQRFEDEGLVRGDPEPSASRIEDLDSLPLTTWAGFGQLQGGALRLLAGRGDRWRSPQHVLREVVYAVETFGIGHLLFDDADLAPYREWLPLFEAELAHLPWRITWEATVDGKRVGGPAGYI